MTTPMLKRLSLALYRKAEALGLCVDPEGSGDLGPSTVLVMAVLEEMRWPIGAFIQEGIAKTDLEKNAIGEFQMGAAWAAMIDAIKEGK